MAIPKSFEFAFRLVDAEIHANGGAVTVRGPDGSIARVPSGARYVFADGVVEEADGSPYVQDLAYYGRNHDVWVARMDADTHYKSFGAREGRSPSSAFDAKAYLAANPDVAAAGMDPLHHYLTFGWREGREASPFFDAEGYLAANPDVAASGMNPLKHYLQFGQSEGRSPLPFLLEKKGFDSAFYLEQNPDVAASGMGAWEHYNLTGRAEGRAPNAVFDAAYYLEQNPDIAAAGLDPLAHYMSHGWREGRDPSAAFDTTKYQESQPDVAAAGLNPMVHFLAHGRGEGRPARPVNEAPYEITLEAVPFDENAEGAVVGRVTVFDPDGAGHSFAVDDARFEVVGGLLKLKDGIALDYEAAASLRVTVTATDPGSLSVSRSFDLAVGDVAEAPVGIALEGAAVAENEAGALVGRVLVDDPDFGDEYTVTVDDTRFDLADGYLKLKDGVALDHEGTPLVRVTLTVTDRAGLSFQQTFEVNVLDANEAPSDLTLDAATVAENEAGAVIGRIGFGDEDAGDTHTVTVDDARFEVAEGHLKLKDGITLDHEGEPTVPVTVTVTDRGGLAVQRAFDVSVANVNEAPSGLFIGAPMVSENAPGAVFGNVLVIDPDVGDSHTFQVSDERFEILGGMFKLKDGIALDHEAEPFVDLSVTVTDAGGLSYTQAHRIQVADVAEAAAFGAGVSPVTIVEDEGISGTEGRSAVISFHDGDRQGSHEVSVTPWTLTGPARGTLSAEIVQAVDPVTGEGRVLWSYNPDQVAIQSLREGETVQETYRLTLSDDPLGPVSTHDIVITLQGKNDAAVVTGQSTGQLTEDTQLSASGQLQVTDVDTGEASFRADLYRGAYGELQLASDGGWTYALTGNDMSEVQALRMGETLADTITVRTADGTAFDLTMTIAGMDEAGPEADWTFENGFTGWDTYGSLVTLAAGPTGQAARIGVANREGSRAIMEAFLGLDDAGSGSLEAHATNGGGIRTSLHLEAGQIVSFDWMFQNLDGDVADHGVFSLDGAAHSHVTTLSTVSTGWSTHQYQVQVSGDYVLGFAAMNGYDDIFGSALWVDNVRVSDQPFLV